MSAPAGSAPFDLTHFPKRNVVITESLSTGLGHGEMAPLDLAPLLKKGGCEFLREALITGGKDYDQPMWNLTTLCATFLEEGERLAHKMGNKHVSYMAEETNEMWERKMRERHEKGLGWPSCSAIQAAGCTTCANCPHLGNIKSPLNLTGPAAFPAARRMAGAPPNLFSAVPGQIVWSPAELHVSLSKLPHRRWLYGTYLIRGEITVVAAPGGVGKTALATGMAVEIATGVELLDETIWGGQDLKVLFINAEDGLTEIERRVWAFCLAHAGNLKGRTLDRLYVVGANDARVQRMSFLQVTEKGLSALNLIGFGVLRSALESLRPDLLILDPLVAFCGGGNMNDNALMSLVIRELKRIAAEFDCAVLIVHHTRKGADAGNAEAISGAAAIVNLARRAIMPVPMADEEAKKLGVLPSDRFRYFKLVDAKSNFAPRSANSPWYELHSVDLPNPEPPIYPHGDNVQAITRVNLALLNNASVAADDQEIRRAILDLVDRGKVIDGQSYPYSPSVAGAKNERSLLDNAMAEVARVAASRQWDPADLKSVTSRTIDMMKAEGWLVEDDMKNLTLNPGRFRKARGLRVDRSRTPWPNAGSDGSSPASDDPARQEDLPVEG
jgi:hypothetical protein